MRAIIPSVPPDILEHRRITGAERYDEMWEGVLHMPPMPNREHQDFEHALEAYLRLRWARPTGGRVYHQINLAQPGGWPKNYRIPDLVVLTEERFSIDKNEYFEGAPEVVVEIRSPGDESYEKMPFYAELGVPELWIIDRDTKSPQVYRLEGPHYRLLASGDQGWTESPSLGLELHAREGKLEIRVQGDDSTLDTLPQ